jgi:cell division septation protein DedD
VGRPAPADEAQPKNGRLTLAVIASLVLMIPLAVLNIRLILDPSIAGKAFGTAVSSRPAQIPTNAMGSSCVVSEGKSVECPPEATFYTRLSAQDEHSRGAEHSGSLPIGQTDLNAPAASTAPAAQGKTAEKRDTRSRGERFAAPAKASSAPPSAETLPRPDGGAKIYMVQVGAFTHPRIAQQWALNWKSRGYDVLLKPVARPGTGVTYRLYLGRFESQKDADALVKRLKAKEGISALTLLVRD